MFINTQLPATLSLSREQKPNDFAVNMEALCEEAVSLGGTWFAPAGLNRGTTGAPGPDCEKEAFEIETDEYGHPKKITLLIWADQVDEFEIVCNELLADESKSIDEVITELRTAFDFDVIEQTSPFSIADMHEMLDRTQEEVSELRDEVARLRMEVESYKTKFSRTTASTSPTVTSTPPTTAEVLLARIKARQAAAPASDIMAIMDDLEYFKNDRLPSTLPMPRDFLPLDFYYDKLKQS